MTVDPTVPASAPAVTHSTPWVARLGGLGGRTLAILAVLALIVAAADRSRIAADWSADRRFSLSDGLQKLLAEQHEPLELVSIWPEELDAAARPLSDGLRVMAGINPRITARHIDPVLHKPALADFAARYREAAAPAIYVVKPSAKRAFRIAVNARTRSVLQREVGGALTSLADPTPPTVAMFQGHGELTAGGGAEDGCDELTRALELAGFRVIAIDTASGGRVPPDAVLLIAGPRAALGRAGLTALDTHLTDGGSALVLADDRAPGDLAALLRRRGVLLGTAPDGLIAAMQSGEWAPVLTGDATPPARVLASLRHHFVGQESAFPHHNLLVDADHVNPTHPVSNAAASGGVALLSPWTTPVQVLQPGNFAGEPGRQLAAVFATLKTPPFVATPLLQTHTGDVWAKSRAEPLQAPDARAPALPLTWAIEHQSATTSATDGHGARLVVWGSRQAASDGVFAQGTFANATLLVDACRWLARRGAATGIPEAETSAFRLTASDGALFWIVALLVAIIPCACIGTAILTWWERR